MTMPRLEAITRIPGYHLYLPILAVLVSATIDLSGRKGLADRQKAEVPYSIGISGFNGLTGFVVHTFFTDWVADSMGWDAKNLFQLEVARANSGTGFIGYLGFLRRDFWLLYIVAKVGFNWTAETTHVIDVASR